MPKRILDSIGWKSWPAGGAEIPMNVGMIFEQVVSKGIKEIELTEKELLGFLKCYGDRLPANAQIAEGDFYFWGVRITIIDGEEYPDCLGDK